MNWDLCCSRITPRRSLIGALLAGVLSGIVAPAHATSFQLTSLTTDDNGNLTSLGFPATPNVDPNLVNPWGVSFGPTTPFWVSDNGAGDWQPGSASPRRRAVPTTPCR